MHKHLGKFSWSEAQKLRIIHEIFLKDFKMIYLHQQLAPLVPASVNENSYKEPAVPGKPTAFIFKSTTEILKKKPA